MRRSWLALFALLFVPALSAQDFREEQNDKLLIKFKVFRKLQATPLELGSADPHTRMKYEPGDDADKIRGQFVWGLHVLEFKKPGAGKGDGKGAVTNSDGKAPEKPEDAVEEAVSDRHRAKNFYEFATEKDPSIKDRTFLKKGEDGKAKGKTPAYKFFEFSDTDSRFGFWYTVAAVYDFPEREVALVAHIPAIGKPKPKDDWLKWARTMVLSLEPLAEKDVTSDEVDAKREVFANTPERKAELEKAKANIANLDGYDYFTTPNYIVLWSWNPKKPERRMQSYKFAKDLVGKLEGMRELYIKEYPPHDAMLQLYSVLRICDDYDEFNKYSGKGGGVVGFFNPANKELVVFDDKDRYFGNKAETVYTTSMHEGWHQYGYSYFGQGAELHRWFDEGTGDYFGSWQRNGKSWSYAVSKERLPGIKSQVARKTFIPPRELVTWEISKFYGSPRVVEHYEQAYSMVDFLRRGEKEMGKKFNPAWGQILDKYRLSMLESKNHKTAVEKAFEGVDWDAWEAAWVEWVKSYMK